MDYETYKKERELLRKFLTGEASTMPCTNCKKGVFRSDPNKPISKQPVFYCDVCRDKLIIN